MRAVWSFWSRPFAAGQRKVWRSEKHHLLAWALSVETARRHLPTTSLITDSEGARLLLDGLRLPFDEVSTELDALAASDPGWWTLGKLHAYRAQERPFVHIDNDVFLWKPLPPRLLAAPLIVQNPEAFAFDGFSWYQPAAVEAAVRKVGGWLPEEWRWQSERRVGSALCCGILGGHRVDFISHYADLAIRIVEHTPNKAAWTDEAAKGTDSVLVEQYLLSACLDYHRAHPGSSFRDVELQCLFADDAEAFDPEAAGRAGYTHLIAGAKRDPKLAARLEARVQRDHPQHHDRVSRLLTERGGPGRRREAAPCA
jgi:hypothetical protein